MKTGGTLVRLTQKQRFILWKELELMRGEITAEGSNWTYKKLVKELKQRLGESVPVTGNHVRDAFKHLDLVLLKPPPREKSIRNTSDRNRTRQRMAELQVSLDELVGVVTTLRNTVAALDLEVARIKDGLGMNEKSVPALDASPGR